LLNKKNQENLSISERKEKEKKTKRRVMENKEIKKIK